MLWYVSELHSFFFKVEKFSIAWIDRILFILSSTDGHLDYFYLLVTVNDAAMNIHLQISVWVSTFNSFGYMPQSEIPGLYGNSMFDFIILFFTWLYHFTFSLAMHQGSNFSTSSPILVFHIHSCARMEETLLYRFLEMELLGQMYMPSRRLYQFILPPSAYGSSYLPFPHPP